MRGSIADRSASARASRARSHGYEAALSAGIAKPMMSSVVFSPTMPSRMGMSSAPSETAASTKAKNTPNTRATTSGLTTRCSAVIASTSTTMVPAPRSTSMRNAIQGACTTANSAVGRQYTAMPMTMMAPRRRTAAIRFMNAAITMPPTPSAASHAARPVQASAAAAGVCRDSANASDTAAIRTITETTAPALR